MKINNLILKHYLRNVMFINGTAYAGKSTMVKMLADKYGLIHCGENYDCVPKGITTPKTHPNLCYFQTMKNWQEFVNRTPQEYSNWIIGGQREIAEFEIAYLISVSQSQKTIVDTNIPIDILREIADYNQVAIMLSPQSMSVEHFINRNDADKAFLKEQIMKSDNPEKTMQNFLACMAECNSKEVYDNFANSGFFTLVRKDAATDTKQETMDILARHFGLETASSSI
ncbi:MAG: hypothetical protein FWC76_07470 [Defluviitaleaceae bacterium]|nr:hypothetical protein [Defluviitaleaceae bacterium]